MQRVLLVADDDRVAGVVAAVELDDVVDAAAEEVGRLALAFVAPLGADDHDRGHVEDPFARVGSPQPIATTAPTLTLTCTSMCKIGVRLDAMPTHAPTRAPRRDAAENREAILDAAAAALNDDIDASLETIAARAGLSRRGRLRPLRHPATTCSSSSFTRGAARVAAAARPGPHADPVVEIALFGATRLGRGRARARHDAASAVRGPLPRAGRRRARPAHARASSPTSSSPRGSAPAAPTCRRDRRPAHRERRRSPCSTRATRAGLSPQEGHRLVDARRPRRRRPRLARGGRRARRPTSTGSRRRRTADARDPGRRASATSARPVLPPFSRRAPDDAPAFAAAEGERGPMLASLIAAGRLRPGPRHACCSTGRRTRPRSVARSPSSTPRSSPSRPPRCRSARSCARSCGSPASASRRRRSTAARRARPRRLAPPPDRRPAARPTASACCSSSPPLRPGVARARAHLARAARRPRRGVDRARAESSPTRGMPVLVLGGAADPGSHSRSPRRAPAATAPPPAEAIPMTVLTLLRSELRRLTATGSACSRSSR